MKKHGDKAWIENHKEGALSRIFSRIFFPLVFFAIMTSATLLLSWGADPILCMLSHMGIAAVLIAAAERFMPHERTWNRSHGDARTDVFHLLVSNFGVSAVCEALLFPLGFLIAAALSKKMGIGLWPREWPLAARGLLAVVVAEFFYYWWHRLSHEIEFLWRFHSVHHSAPRLYWLNAVRFHPIDAFIGYVAQTLPLVVLGAGAPELAWHTIFLGVHGPFQHSNLYLRLGALNWIFSMAELHRWHHSPRLEEGNTNYGGNLILWDIVFQTRYLPRDRDAGRDIGVGGVTDYPQGYLGQLAAPFRWRKMLGVRE